MRRLSPREFRRLAERMGLELGELEGVREVIIRLEDKELFFEAPKVNVMKIQNETIYQILGTPVERSLGEAEAEIEISEEDVQLVALQAGVSEEEARQALKETKGDLAKAIILLSSRKK
ncbi:MAG: nascent polypeptide-associated complex protein [Thermofilum sp. ex4484_82]|nr:MAG: nascent polypeptide-associated complex protein [Thermofilum sp. ex4484_82]OYT39340.1 MAG: nascent polypeptide-associated complex protein [Archaeoglobales archaeon ex4484_92]RLE76933.1 MAG: nascent polypeptide-associated complex protein [Thermoprotei archaeon]